MLEKHQILHSINSIIKVQEKEGRYGTFKGDRIETFT